MQKDILYETVIQKEFLYSFDKQRIPLNTVHEFLTSKSYWALGIPRSVVEQSVEHSICLGVYDTSEDLVGFGRMITDRATFGYLADIFVLESFRGQGISKKMMELFCQLAEQFGLRRFLLTTQDAHSLYAQSGFIPFPWPERLMSRPGIIY